MKKNHKPVLIIDSDGWSSDTQIFFDDDQFTEWCPSEWVSDRLAFSNSNIDVDTSRFTQEQIFENMRNEFFRDNSSVDGYDSEKNICWDSFGNYYQYDENGATVIFLGNFDSYDDAMIYQKGITK